VVAVEVTARFLGIRDRPQRTVTAVSIPEVSILLLILFGDSFSYCPSARSARFSGPNPLARAGRLPKNS
jgi:hypothetical protein